MHLGYAVNDEKTRGVRDGLEGGGVVAVENEAAVDLIADEPRVVVEAPVGDLADPFGRVEGAGGVREVGEDDGPGARGAGPTERSDVHEAVPPDGHRFSGGADGGDAGEVAWPAGLYHEHVVARSCDCG